MKGRIQPVSLGGAISAIFVSQVLQWLRYCKRNEVYNGVTKQWTTK